MNRYRLMVTMVPGLEQIVADELKEKISNIEITTISRGKVIFDSAISLNQINKLQTIDNAYLIIKQFRIGKHKSDLNDLYEELQKIDLREVFTYLSHAKKGKIIVSASRKGKHTYSRFDLSDTAAKAILDANKELKPGDPKDHEFAFRLDINEDSCLFSCQLTKASFKFRGEEYEFSPGCIRPSISHALVRISQPNNYDTFYDPFCGSGSIPKERTAYKARRIYASDISEAALNKAIHNLPHYVETFCSDAINTPLQNHNVNVIVTNLPWGKQITVNNIYNLYHEFLKEAIRILAPDGRIILFTDQYEALERAISKHSMICEKLYTVSLHGLLPCVYRLTI